MRQILSFIVFFLILFSASLRVFAQEINIDYPQNASQSSQKIEYTLAYPGILPDNPLYIIKAARDRIVSLLINDPMKRAEFDLLTSDKRVYAAQLLAGRGKVELAYSTLSKSNNYLDECIASIVRAKKAGQDTSSVLNNLRPAIAKHIQVTESIEKKVGGKFKEQFVFEVKRLENFDKTARTLLPQQ